MKRRLAALEARLGRAVDAIPAPREPVDAAEVLQVLHQAGAFPKELNQAIEREDANTGELIAEWLERSVQ